MDGDLWPHLATEGRTDLAGHDSFGSAGIQAAESLVEIPVSRVRREHPLLPRSFYAGPTIEVAQALLGKFILHGETAGRIVETEAYLGQDDLAAHSARGLTDRTRVIFGPPGHAYVYLIYGMYECLNLVAEPEGTPGCVLIRAVEPVSGILLMRQRRPAARKAEALTSGPGRLTLALGITRDLNGADVTRGPLQVRDASAVKPEEIVTSTRVGITHCADWPLRFYLRGNRFVSRF